MALVLGFMGLIGMAVVAGAAVLYFLSARGPSVPDEATLVMRPGGGLLDTRPDDVVAQVIGSEGTSIRGMVESLRKAKRDPRIRSALLRPSTVQTPFWAKLQELRDALIDFRESGKPVIAYLEYGGDREYYLATAASQIFLLPASPLDLSGIASYEVFLRGALDKIGAEPDFLQIGAYKTAPNQLTQTGLTPEHRAMSEWLNRDLYEQMVLGIAQARRKTPGEVRALLDEGPFPPEDALRTGLVDGLAYLDQLDDRVASLKVDDGEDRYIEESAYQRVSARSVGIRPDSRIAVLSAAGVIVGGKSAFDPLNGPVVGSDTVVDQIQRIRDDDSIRAIVVRIDSPGGSATASDVIWRELMITRDANPRRPIVVSMSDLAASGGYYIATPAHVIVAEPATLTGSIGIFGGKIAIGGTLDRLGINTETIASGRNADLGSPFEPFRPEQRVRLMAYMQGFYDDFVRKVAASRRRSVEQVDAVAQGRVWTGQQARQHGLVDVLGGLDTAVAIAKERAGIPADEDVELVGYPPRRTFIEALSDRFGTSSAGIWTQLAGGLDGRALAALTAPVRLFRRGEPLALMPYAFVR
jgi:protease-4